MADVVIPGRGSRASAFAGKLRLSTALATAGTSFVADILGAPANTTVSIKTNPSSRYQLVNNQLVGYGPTLVAGTDTVVLTLTPNSGSSVTGGPADTSFSITVAAALALSGASSTEIVLGGDFSFTPTVAGGTAPIKFALGHPHRGLVINENTGQVVAVGATEQLGGRKFTINATDAVGATASVSSVLSIVQGTVDPVFNVLSLSAAGIVETAAPGTVVGAVMGQTAGSTLSITNTAGSRFALSGTNIVAGSVATDFETGQSHQITLREAKSGFATRDTVITINVSNQFEQPSLGALGLSQSAFTLGTPATGSITGATPNSTIVPTALPQGFTINSTNRTWAYNGTGAASSFTVILTENLSDSPNSGRVSNLPVTYSAAVGGTIPALNVTTLTTNEFQSANALVASYSVDPSIALEGEGEPFWLNRLVLSNPTAGNWEVRTGAEKLNWWKDREFCSLSPAFKLTQSRNGSTPVSQQITLNLNPVVRTPSWPAVPFLPLLREGETFDLDLTAFQDGGSGTTTYAIVSGAPAGTSINASTGIVTFAPGAGVAGDYDTIIFSGTNSAGTGQVTFRMWVVPEKWVNWTGHSVDQTTGLTNLVLHPSARRIWVNSIAGSQSNDGLTPATARQSVRAAGIGTGNTTSAYDLVRNGMGDQLMISSNSVINGTDFFFNISGSRSFAGKTGLNAQYPIVITTYDVNDPTNEAMYGILRANVSADGTNPWQHTTGTGGKFILVRGFDLSATMGPSRDINHIGIENLHFENMQFGYTAMNCDTAKKVSFRHCTSAGPFSSGTGIGPSGTHSGDTYGYVKECFVSTHAGWNGNRETGYTTGNGGQATIFNHGDYQSIPTRFSGTFMSLYNESSATGAQYRSGVRIDRTTFTRCPISLQLGQGNDCNLPYDPDPNAPNQVGPQSGLEQRTRYGAHEGVFAVATKIIIDQGNDLRPTAARGIGIAIGNLAPGSRIENFLLTNHTSVAANPSPLWIYPAHNLWSLGSSGDSAMRPSATKGDLCDPYGRWDTGPNFLYKKGTVHRAGSGPLPADHIGAKTIPFYNPEGTKIVSPGPKPWLVKASYNLNVAPFGGGATPDDADFVDPTRTVATFAVSRGYASHQAWVNSLVADPLKIRTEYPLMEAHLLAGWKLSSSGLTKHGATFGAVNQSGSWMGSAATGVPWTFPAVFTNGSLPVSLVQTSATQNGVYSSNYNAANFENTGTLYYISPTGNDTTGDGLSPSTAWRTAQKWADTAPTGSRGLLTGGGRFGPCVVPANKNLSLTGPTDQSAVLGDLLTESAITWGTQASGRQTATLASGAVSGFVDALMTRRSWQGKAIPQVSISAVNTSSAPTASVVATWQGQGLGAIARVTPPQLGAGDGRNLSGKADTELMMWKDTAAAPVAISGTTQFFAKNVTFVGGAEILCPLTSRLVLDTCRSLGAHMQNFSIFGTSVLRNTVVRGCADVSSDLIDYGSSGGGSLSVEDGIFADQCSPEGGNNCSTFHAVSLGLRIGGTYLDGARSINDVAGSLVGGFGLTLQGGGIAGTVSLANSADSHWAGITLLSRGAGADLMFSNTSVFPTSRTYVYDQSFAGKVQTDSTLGSSYNVYPTDRTGFMPTADASRFLIDPSNLSTLFQTADTSTPVTASGQPVVRINNAVNTSEYALVAAGTYTYQTDGTLHWLQTGTSNVGRIALNLIDTVLDERSNITYAIKSSDTSGFLFGLTSTNTAGDYRGSSALNGGTPKPGMGITGSTYHVDGNTTPITATGTALKAAAFNNVPHVITTKNANLSYTPWMRAPNLLNTFDGNVYRVDISRATTDAVLRSAHEAVAAAKSGATLV